MMKIPLTNDDEYDPSFGEDLVADHEDEEEDIPQVPTEKDISPIIEQVERENKIPRRKSRS